VIALRTLYARREHAAATSCVMDAIKTPWERRVDAVGTLWGSGVHPISGKLDSKIDVFRVDPTVRWQVFRTLYKRCGIAVWCDRGLSKEASDTIFITS